ncbi:alkaline phosphatase D family protein [Plantactinospora siamensis]|uniref:Alkaline phosphatase D family protein n=1 Tax=Plantactinospora siamensis TaxID=555372 RepID=A0ABV6NT11_9ACTN
MTPELLVGPLLRRVVDTRATIWVETSAPALVRVGTPDGAAGQAETFTVQGHHYAIVIVDGLEPDSSTPYQVFLDDERVWPEPGSGQPPSMLRTRAADDAAQPVRLVFGSCRETTQHATTRRLPPDALDAYARRLMAGGEPPDLLVLLGDQVYADVTSPRIRRLLRRRRRRPRGAPDDQVVTYDEYTKLYLESWRDPEIRWLFSTVPSVMIFDDHEIIDDWNTSASWRADMRDQPWWAERIASGLASYWVYQHLGNLHPDEIATDPVYAAVRAAGDGSTVLRELAAQIDAEADEPPSERPRRYQFSYTLDIGRTRLIMLDNRCSRVLNPGQRAMLPAAEWAWFLDRAHGSYDHLVVGASLPWLMPPGIHHIEAWNERLAESPRPRVAAWSERVRRSLDLEHWAAFRRSFEAMAELFARLGAGEPATRGRPGTPGDRVGAGPAYPPPATISVLSGDVHHSYVARARFPVDIDTPVHQLTCSPIHNQVPAPMRPLMRLGWWRGPARAVRALASAAGVPHPPVRWRRTAGPYFGNAVTTLRYAGDTADVSIEGTTKEGELRRVAAVPLRAQARTVPAEPDRATPPAVAAVPGGTMEPDGPDIRQ